MQTILQGGSTRQRIASLLDEGFDPAKARVLVNFERSVRDDVEGAEVDWNAVTSFQTELYADGFNTANGLSQITALAEAGQLGSGQARLQLVNQFVTRLGQVESARQRDPRFRGLLNQLSAEYSGSSIMERLDPRYKQRRAKAEGLFTELVAVQGIDAQAAYDQVTGDNGIPKLTADNAGSGLSAVLPLVLQGRTDASALIEFKPAGVSLADYIEALESEHGITFTTDQLKQLNGAR